MLHTQRMHKHTCVRSCSYDHKYVQMAPARLCMYVLVYAHTYIHTHSSPHHCCPSHHNHPQHTHAHIIIIIIIIIIITPPASTHHPQTIKLNHIHQHHTLTPNKASPGLSAVQAPAPAPWPPQHPDHLLCRAWATHQRHGHKSSSTTHVRRDSMCLHMLTFAHTRILNHPTPDRMYLYTTAFLWLGTRACMHMIMLVCTCVYTHEHIYACLHACIYAKYRHSPLLLPYANMHMRTSSATQFSHANMSMSETTYDLDYVQMYMHICMCICICMYMYMYKCICIYVYVHVHVHVYMYIYI